MGQLKAPSMQTPWLHFFVHDYRKQELKKSSILGLAILYRAARPIKQLQQ